MRTTEIGRTVVFTPFNILPRTQASSAARAQQIQFENRPSDGLENQPRAEIVDTVRPAPDKLAVALLRIGVSE